MCLQTITQCLMMLLFNLFTNAKKKVSKCNENYRYIQVNHQIPEMSNCNPAVKPNNGLSLQKHFIAVHACSLASSESLQGAKVLIDTFTPYQIEEKAQFLRKHGTFLKNPIWRTKTKNVINVCMH